MQMLKKFNTSVDYIMWYLLYIGIQFIHINTMNLNLKSMAIFFYTVKIIMRP